MNRLRRREHASRFARERTGNPKARGAIQKVLQRRRHVSEASGAAQHESVGVPQILERCVRRSGGGHRFRRALALRRDHRHRAQLRRRSRNAFDAATDLSSELCGRAVPGVVEHQYFGHAEILDRGVGMRNQLQPCQSKARITIRCHRRTGAGHRKSIFSGKIPRSVHTL